MKKVIVLLFCLLANLSLIKGQSSLGIDSTSSSYMYNDTTTFNATDFYAVTVLNYGPQPYSGDVFLEYAVDSANNGTLVPLATFSFTASNMGVLAGQTDSATISIMTGIFRSGINTVVIWPRMGSTPFTTNDSLKLAVLVMDFAGIQKNELRFNQKLFPNPAGQVLFVSNPDPNFVIERVSFWTPEGKLIHAEPFKGKLDISSLPTGSCFIEFTSTLGKTTRYKLIKE